MMTTLKRQKTHHQRHRIKQVHHLYDYTKNKNQANEPNKTTYTLKSQNKYVPRIQSESNDILVVFVFIQRANFPPL